MHENLFVTKLSLAVQKTRIHDAAFEVAYMAEGKYTETVRKLKSDKIQVRFGEAVRQDFGRLHDMLKHEETFDDDALSYMKNFSDAKLKRDVPTAFAATIEVFLQVTAFAEKTKNPKLLEELDHLFRDLSGNGTDRTPVEVVSVTPHR